MSNLFARLGAYFWFIVRRERALSAIWIACIAGLSAMFAALYPSLLPGKAQLQQMAAIMSNPAMAAMMGSVYGVDSLSQASVMAQECLVWFFVAIAVMNIFLVNRHTRADEEPGRLELLRALPVGRLSGSAAAILFALCVNLLAGALTGALLLAVNIGGTTVSGALVYGFAIGAVGFVFAGLTLLAAQLFSTARGVGGCGFGALVLFYILRAIGDTGSGALSILSPLGLGLKVEAFYSDAAAPILLLMIEGIALSLAALAVCAVRDHGAGVLPARKGRAHASRLLRGPLGFAWRVSRGAALGWAAGLLVLGAAYGSASANIGDFVAGNEMIQKILGANGAGALADNYVALVFNIMSMVASVPVVLTALRLRGEERAGRIEQLIGRAVPRGRLFGGFLLIALAESAAMELLLALGLYAAAGGTFGLWPLLKAGLCYLPAIWAMAGLAALLAGFWPRLSALVWAVFGYTFIVMYAGRIVELPEWMARISPFGSIPQLPLEEFTAAPLIALTLIAAALCALGVWRFGRRDVG